MRFIVRKTPLTGVALKVVKTDIVQLKPADWDDYSYRTTFDAIFYSAKNPSKPVELGSLKIIKRNQKRKTATLDLLREDKLLEFDQLPDNYCSLGQEELFYAKIGEFGKRFYNKFFISLNDIYVNPEIGHTFENRRNPAFEESLIRRGSAAILYEPLSNKKAKNKLKFSSDIYIGSAEKPHSLSIDFTPLGNLPNRMFVLVGKNGVGKTQLLGRLGFLISGGALSTSKNKRSIQKNDTISNRGLFRNVIAISFSAFDDFEIPSDSDETNISYRYWGLREQDRSQFSTDELLDRVCEVMSKQPADRRAIFDHYLKNITPDITFSDLVNSTRATKQRLKSNTSAGQRIMISVIAGLASFLEKNSILLFDEPEIHLHPSLLTTMLSSINGLLEEFDSYAIISTHSPIVLQQVPARYVRVIRRMENTPSIDHPSIETFGENLTEISQKIFDVSDYERDYKDIFIELLELHDNNAEIVSDLFDDKLGMSAKTLLYSLAKRR